MTEREDAREDTFKVEQPKQAEFVAVTPPPISRDEEVPSPDAETEQEYGEDVEDDAGQVVLDDLSADPNGLLEGEVSHGPNRPPASPYPAGGKTQDASKWD